LLTLNVEVTAMYARFDALFQAVEQGQATSQYLNAITALANLRQLWEGSSSGVIADKAIVEAYTALDVAAHERLPDGSAGARRQRELSTGDKEVGQRFVRDLGHVLGLLDWASSKGKSSGRQWSWPGSERERPVPAACPGAFGATYIPLTTRRRAGNSGRGLSEQLSDNPGSRAGTPVDVRGRSQQVSGAMLQGGGVSLCPRDEETTDLTRPYRLAQRLMPTIMMLTAV